MSMQQLFTGKKPVLAIIALLAVAAFQYLEHGTLAVPGPDTVAQPADTDSWSAGDWVTLEGKVTRTLGDDNTGSRHQRFIISVPGGRTLLVAHNIDLAERVPVKTGERVSMHGRYETNQQGGVIHWTHHDPDNSGSGGWIDFNGKRYR